MNLLKKIVYFLFYFKLKIVRFFCQILYNCITMHGEKNVKYSVRLKIQIVFYSTHLNPSSWPRIKLAARERI
jgi:hypothetical protein